MIRPPLVPLELDKLRHLCLDLPALELAEEKLSELEGEKVYIFEVLADSKNRMRMRNVRILLWAACRYEDPNVTDIEVGSWLHLGNFSRVVQALDRCVLVSQSESEPASNGNGGAPVDPPPAESIGSASGLSAELSSASETMSGEA